MNDASGEEIPVHRERVPGHGYRYAFTLRDGHQLVIVTSTSATGAVEVHALAAGDERPAASIELTHGEAAAVAALLSDMRIVLEDDG